MVADLYIYVYYNKLWLYVNSWGQKMELINVGLQ